MSLSNVNDEAKSEEIPFEHNYFGGIFSSSILFFASSDMSRTDLKNFLSLYEFLNKLT